VIFKELCIPEVVHASKFCDLLCVQGFENIVYEKLSAIKNAKVYKKEEMPDRFHYKNNRRIAPIVLFADSEFRICDDEKCGELKGSWILSL
jgi:hypothetical protein